MKCKNIDKGLCLDCLQTWKAWDPIPECLKPQMTAAQAVLELQKVWGIYEPTISAASLEPPCVQTKQKCSCTMTTLLRTGCACGGV